MSTTVTVDSLLAGDRVKLPGYDDFSELTATIDDPTSDGWILYCVGLEPVTLQPFERVEVERAQPVERRGLMHRG